MSKQKKSFELDRALRALSREMFKDMPKGKVFKEKNRRYREEAAEKQNWRDYLESSMSEE